MDKRDVNEMLAGVLDDKPEAIEQARAMLHYYADNAERKALAFLLAGCYRLMDGPKIEEWFEKYKSISTN